MEVRPEILILSSRGDFSCDYVVAHLMSRGVPYLRLNTEDLASYALCLDPLRGEFLCTIKDTTFRIEEETLRSVWFRRAVYLRDYGLPAEAKASEQIARSQWAALVRGLVVFQRAKWVNHPGATYLAEQKPLQLSLAQKAGFRIPETLITNDARKLARFRDRDIAIKGVDTVIAFESGNEVFAFTNILPSKQVSGEEIGGCPIIAQEAISPKTDLRVTVVGSSLFAVCVENHGTGILGDWRSQKEGLSYRPVVLPERVESACLALTKKLGLLFGAIDLAKRGDEYFFFEINPTGEWAWLVDSAGVKIDEAIADVLVD
jgi:hypothetical protein